MAIVNALLLTAFSMLLALGLFAPLIQLIISTSHCNSTEAAESQPADASADSPPRLNHHALTTTPIPATPNSQADALSHGSPRNATSAPDDQCDQEPGYPKSCTWWRKPYFNQVVVSQPKTEPGEPGYCAAIVAFSLIEFAVARARAATSPADMSFLLSIQGGIDCVVGPMEGEAQRQILSILERVDEMRDAGKGIPTYAAYKRLFNGEINNCLGFEHEFLARAYSLPPSMRKVSLQNMMLLLEAGPFGIEIQPGWSFFSYRELSPDGFYTPNPSEGSPGKHGVWVLGYRVNGGSVEFLVKNSWSADWGFQGYVWVRLGNPALMDFNNYLHIVRVQL